MDNICHTLAGLAIGETGLKRRASSGSVTLMIGANLPDVDVLAYAWSPVTALGFRRGWTHGVLAMAVWPFVLAGVMFALGRLLERKGTGAPGHRGTEFRGLLLLSAIAVWSHPLLDLLNTYGVRLLMPFSNRWFYGDTLFIVDPWLWLTLLLGVVLARLAQRRGSPRPFRAGRVAVATALAYIGSMALLGVLSRGAARRALAAEGLVVQRLMAGPRPLNPLGKTVVAEVADGYTSARVDWFRGRSPDGTPITRAGPIVWWSGAQWTRNDTLPGARRAAGTPEGAIFLSWARFPYFETGGDCDRGSVCIGDLRYFGEGWAEVAVPVGEPLSSPASP